MLHSILLLAACCGVAALPSPYRRADALRPQRLMERLVLSCHLLHGTRESLRALPCCSDDLFEGDILLLPGGAFADVARNAVSDEGLLWPSPNVPYVIDSSFNESE